MSWPGSFNTCHSALLAFTPRNGTSPRFIHHPQLHPEKSFPLSSVVTTNFLSMGHSQMLPRTGRVHVAAAAPSSSFPPSTSIPSVVLISSDKKASSTSSSSPNRQNRPDSSCLCWLYRRRKGEELEEGGEEILLPAAVLWLLAGVRRNKAAAFFHPHPRALFARLVVRARTLERRTLVPLFYRRRKGEELGEGGGEISLWVIVR